MAVTIIVSVIIAVWLVINIRKMVLNVKNGKSIDGCNGDCSHCKSCVSQKKSK